MSALHEHEQGLAGLVESGGRLSIAFAEAQRALSDRLGYLGGHQVMAQFARAQTHVSEATADVADGHRKLSRIGSVAGYRFDDGDGGSDFGDWSKDPKSLLKLLLDGQAEEPRQAS